MSAWLPSQPFVVNDLEYAPFGLSWLRGVTPARLALIAVLAFWYEVSMQERILSLGVGRRFVQAAARFSLHYFAGALPMLLLVAHAERASNEWQPARQIVALAKAVIGGAAILALLVYGIRYVLWGRGFSLNVLLFGIVFGGFATAVAYLARRARQADRLRDEARLAEARLERQIVEARLQLLHAQIEPHFLFNSLASVKRLYDTDPALGRRLIGNLRVYLGEAITKGRLRETSLGEEIALARAYLEIFKVRMGERLRVDVAVTPELQGARVPPLMLGTLVENAVKHGISPRATGGLVRIEAQLVGESLEVRVVDDGVGFRDRSGPGLGLANTRARLHALFGNAGDLEIATNAGSGVTATVRLPFRLPTAIAEAA